MTITVEDLKSVVPKGLQTVVNQDLVNQVNNSISDPQALEIFKANILDYSAVLHTGRYKMADYLNAVRYVTLKHMGLTNQKAYELTFPDRVKRLKAEGRTDQQISQYVSAYHKTKLVSKITEQNMIAVYVANAGVFQQAVNHQARLMQSAKSEKVQSDAADSLMRHLKPPEMTKYEVPLGVSSEGQQVINELRETIGKLSEAQKTAIIENRTSIKEVAEADIIKTAPQD